VRHPDPLSCRGWYDLKTQGNTIARDMSRSRNHGEIISAPPEIAALSHAYAPIRGIKSYQERGGRKRLYVQAANLPYIVEVT